MRLIRFVNVSLLAAAFFLFFDNKLDFETLHAPLGSLKSQPNNLPISYAVFSTDLLDLQYAAVAPLTAFIYRQVHDVIPIVFLESSPAAPPSLVLRLLLHYLHRAGARVHCLQSDVRDRIATTMQVSRLAAWSLSYVRPFDSVFTTDADIWPLDREFWKSRFYSSSETGKLFIYNGPYYNEQINAGSCDFVALTTVGATRSLWSELFRIWERHEKAAPGARACSMVNHDSGLQDAYRFNSTLITILDASRRAYGKKIWEGQLSSKQKHTKLWGCDQFLISEMVSVTGWCPDYCSINNDIRRLDRGKWQYNGHSNSYTDAHLPYPLSDAGVFGSILPLWSDLVGESSAFATEFMEHLKLLHLGQLPLNFGFNETCDNM